MINLLGTLGAILLGGCCLPQTIKTIKSNRADDISWGFLSMWVIGELLMISYVSMQDKVDYILLFNYIINIILLCPILFIKWRSKDEQLAG